MLTLNRSLSLVCSSTSKTTGEMSFPKREEAWRLFSVTLRQKHHSLPATTPAWRAGDSLAIPPQLLKKITDLLRKIISEVSLS